MSVRTTRLAGLDGPELKDATFAARAFPAHFHDTLSIGVVRSGRERIGLGEVTVDAGPGLAAIIPPGLVHDHGAVDGEAWRYQAVYVSPALVAHRGRRLGLVGARLEAGLVDDEALCAALGALHAAASGQGRQVIAIVDHLLVHHATAGRGDAVAARAAAMDDAAALLRARVGAQPRLAELARRFGLGPYQLVRAFRARHGLTPAVYAMVARINEARRLLGEDRRIGDVAVAVGFYDQSHFVRYFTKYTGLPPSAYRRGTTRA